MSTNMETTKYKRKHTNVSEKNISLQLGEILKICNQLKIGQVKIGKEQKKLQKQITNLELKLNSKDNASKLEDTTKLQDGLKKIEHKIAEKVETLGKEISMKVDKNGTVVQNKIKTYADMVASTSSSTSNQMEVIEQMNKKFEVVSEGLEKSSETIMTLNKNISNVKSHMDIEKERNIKKYKEKNIIIYNVPESEGNEETEVFKEDIRKIQTIFKNRVNLEKEEVKEIRRIGREKNESRARPICMSFNNIEKQTEILKLRNVTYVNETKDETNIYITIDRTKQEQAVHKELVSKLKEMKANGEENLYIKNGKIVTIQPFRPDPQEYWG